MRVLIIKMSSLGDIIHTFPALTDAARHIPGIQFDWVVEKSFQELPKLHKQVQEVIVLSLRQWRHRLVDAWQQNEIQSAFHLLRKQSYDYVIDAQGLLKSGLIGILAKGKCVGFDKYSAREPLVSVLYQKKYRVMKNLHAVTRLRQLFAQGLGYSVPQDTANFEIDTTFLPLWKQDNPYCVFLHGTTWTTKHWPDRYWESLAAMLVKRGLKVYLPYNNQIEYARAHQIQAKVPGVEILPRLTLLEIGGLLQKAHSVIGVDTGLVHLSAALNVPTLSLYGPSDPLKSGPIGKHQKILGSTFQCIKCLKRHCHYPGPKSIDPPCFGALPPQLVFEQWDQLINSG